MLAPDTIMVVYYKRDGQVRLGEEGHSKGNTDPCSTLTSGTYPDIDVTLGIGREEYGHASRLLITHLQLGHVLLIFSSSGHVTAAPSFGYLASRRAEVPPVWRP